VDPEFRPKNIAKPGFREESIPYLLRSFNWLNQWGILPEPGGLLNQPRAWIEDMELMNAMKEQVKREYELWRQANGANNPGANPAEQ
jgi:hypothetical protein